MGKIGHFWPIVGICFPSVNEVSIGSFSVNLAVETMKLCNRARLIGPYMAKETWPVSGLAGIFITYIAGIYRTINEPSTYAYMCL